MTREDFVKYACAFGVQAVTSEGARADHARNLKATAERVADELGLSASAEALGNWVNPEPALRSELAQAQGRVRELETELASSAARVVELEQHLEQATAPAAARGKAR